MAAMICISGPPCVPGKMALSICFAYCSLQRIMPPLGPRRVLCVVVVTTSAHGHGAGVHAGGHKAGDVRDIHHQIRTDFIGDLAEFIKIQHAGIGAEHPATIIFGLCLRACSRT